MLGYLWPLVLIIVSNVVYQLCTKGVPEQMDPFASLTITYSVGALVSLGLYLVLNRGGNLLQEYKRLNWAPLVLGLVIVGLEAGYIYAYKAGWSVSALPIVQAAVVAIVLIFVGLLLYQDAITWNKVLGIAVCVVGLALINMKG